MFTKRNFGIQLILITIILSLFAQVHFITTLYAIEEPVISDSPSTTNFNLRKIGQYIGGNEIVDVEVENNIAYLADQIEGLLVVNISNIDLPILLDTYQAEDESIYDITLQDGFAYLAHGRAGFRIIDITNPSNVVEVGGYNNGGIAWKVFIINTYAYVADRLQGIEIIDITNKANPTKIGVYDGQPYDVFVREDYAYVAAGLNKGLEIVDISNPASPKKVGETEVNFEDTVGVFVEGDYAFVANKENGIKIIKIKYARNPKIITEFTNITEGSRVWAIYVENSFAYLACENKGIQILDVTEITIPYKIGEFSDESGKAFGLAVEDNLIYLADFNDGLEIISWRVAPPQPMADNYIQVDSAIKNFNHSVGPFAIDTFLGNESLGLNLSLYLDVGLMSLINLTVEAPHVVNPGDIINLAIGVTGESSYFWGRFEGTIEFTTPLGSSELFSLEDVGLPKYLQLAAFQTFIGENILMNDVVYPVTLWSQDILNYSLSLVMVPYFNVSGSATISANINDSINTYELDWIQDRDKILIPIQIPEDAEDFFAVPLNDLQFTIDELHIDLYYIRFDVLLLDLVPVYSWEINISDFSTSPQAAYKPFIMTPTQANNNTLLFLDGIYPLGNFLITIYFTGRISLPTWAILLTLLGLIALLVIPFALIIASTRRKRRLDAHPRAVEE